MSTRTDPGRVYHSFQARKFVSPFPDAKSEMLVETFATRQCSCRYQSLIPICSRCLNGHPRFSTEEGRP
ncbi:hypothetical protein Y032_0135g1944 [Ancylostoma ceylanicum]|uniref:Uncharacterized protein n=1 Tax=Ancylostoma ceylanicum TaxID=53326 RepID=A0A016T4W2_9BILA|nr:hypothetical protein Y032_0135g1944 [Ancylostoma ceylanicum]